MLSCFSCRKFDEIPTAPDTAVSALRKRRPTKATAHGIPPGRTRIAADAANSHDSLDDAPDATWRPRGRRPLRVLPSALVVRAERVLAVPEVLLRVPAARLEQIGP